MERASRFFRLCRKVLYERVEGSFRISRLAGGKRITVKGMHSP